MDEAHAFCVRCVLWRFGLPYFVFRAAGVVKDARRRIRCMSDTRKSGHSRSHLRFFFN